MSCRTRQVIYLTEKQSYSETSAITSGSVPLEESSLEEQCMPLQMQIIGYCQFLGEEIKEGKE